MTMSLLTVLVMIPTTAVALAVFAVLISLSQLFGGA
jgi:hypothetical protein